MNEYSMGLSRMDFSGLSHLTNFKQIMADDIQC